MFGIGASELVLFMLIALLILGANRIPDIGRSLSEAMREKRKTGQDGE